MRILEAIRKTLVYTEYETDNGMVTELPDWFADAFSVPVIILHNDKSLKVDVYQYIELFEHAIKVIDMSDEPITDEMRANIGLMHEGKHTIIKVLTSAQDYYMNHPK